MPSIILALIIVEIFVRLSLSPSDIPNVVFDPILGNKYTPNQRGIYTKGKGLEIKATYRINNDGWNSPYDYTKGKQSGVFRMAVIGDSFVEGLQVDHNKSYPYLLENELNKLSSKRIEVYSFGHSGASLVQHIHTLAYVLNRYNPNLVILNFSYNDFQESLYGYNRTDNWSLGYQNGLFIEKPPKQIGNLLTKQLARKSALIRYLTINLDLFHSSPLVNKIFYYGTRHYESNVDLSSSLLHNDALLEGMMEYILGSYSQLTNDSGIKLLVVMDTNRQAIYNSDDVRKTRVYKLNQATNKIAHLLGISIIDLTNTFEESWRKTKTKFEWDIDNHWNEFGHGVVADSLANWILINNVLTP